MHSIKKRLAMVAPGLLALVAVGLWLSRPSIEPSVPEEPMPDVPNIPKQATTPAVTSTMRVIKQPFARTPMLGLADPRWKKYEAMRKADPSWEWRTPIEFFGKVVGENSVPVSEATVEIEWNGTSERYGGDGVGHRTLSSNSNGLFTVAGIEGKGMSVRVRKDGYYTRKSSNNASFEYAGFWEPNFIEPDRNNPIVFHLVKKREAEPTYHLDSRVIVKAPALEAHLDLLSKPVQRAAPSDLFVRITRPPDASHQKPFDWKIEIEGRNGSELAESEEEFMTLAPTEGYQARLLREHKELTSGSWPKIHFYVRSKARNFYAAVEIEAAAYYPFAGEPGAALFVTATINPNNSPNVEYDPAKDIRKTANK